MLDRIVAERRDAVRGQRSKTPISTLEESRYWGQSRRPFADALRRKLDEPIRFVAEIKRASPSAGVIRPGADVAAIAREYEEAGASALSILTEPLFFDGDPAFLGVARETTKLPLLMKDFIVDEWQILQARSLGADAVLLIVAACDPVQLRDLAAVSRETGLATLVETHDEGELDRALEIGCPIIGINHRDLRTLEIDLGLSERILPRIPPGVIRIGESGIATRDDVLRLSRLPFDALLVGERLMKARSPGMELRRLRGAS